MRNYGERISYRGGDWTGVASAGNGDLASERGRTFSWHSVGFRAFMRNYGEFYMTHGGSNGSGVYGGLFNIEIDSRMKDNCNGSKGFRASFIA